MSMHNNGSKPDLPIPARERWQPLRLGLVDLFHYDSEEFWFRDGHLLLRGNNGTGKSKVLSLTLPFLFDAQLKSSRVEPDGDASKKMSWNLLLGKHERRMGYTWIEFGRLSEDGQPRYLTLGSGLFAVAARSNVDSWFFILDGWRIGQDVWLTSPQRVVLTKERLRETLADHGQVYDTAASYRRAVDEHLFQLGIARYSALMDTLIQLRQPQLSKKPDEASLSAALTEALPPLSPELLTDVADALNQLEEDRRQLQEYQALARSVGHFTDRYRNYAKTQSRRQARGLRGAQTGFDSASRALNDARSELEVLQAVEEEANAAQLVAKETVSANRTRLEVLQSDPINKDANRLDFASKDAADRQRDAEQADVAAKASKDRFLGEQNTTAERSERVGRVGNSLLEVRKAAIPFVELGGIAHQWNRGPLTGTSISELAALSEQACESAKDDLRQVIEQRRGHVGLMRDRRKAGDDAEREHDLNVRAHQDRNDEARAAQTRRDAADQAVEREGRALLDAWETHFGTLEQLILPDAQESLRLLAIWIVTLTEENPARASLREAQQLASERLATLQSALMAERRAIALEEADLGAERERLEKGEDGVPSVPPFRAAGVRVDRAGAPFWQLVDFRDGLDAAQRAGLEAALEASGLLDAWVSPDGAMHTPSGIQPLHDTELVGRVHRSETLANWLQPAGDRVAAGIVMKLLHGMSCTASDNGQAETWLSPAGCFRIGALCGAWSKPIAIYIGYAARAAARTRRLEAISVRLAELAQAQTDLGTRFAEQARDQERAAAEWRNAPTDDLLRASHVEAASSAREFGVASIRLEQAAQQLAAAVETLMNARLLLQRDAQDLHLPADHAGLNAVEVALTQVVEKALTLVHVARELRQARAELLRQQEREQDAKRDAELNIAQAVERGRQANDAKVRLETLQETVGAKVAELQVKLEAARTAVNLSEKSFEQKDNEARLAGEQRARADQKVTSAEETLQERTATRQQAIVRLQGFAATDLLSIALPEIDLPDPRGVWTIEPALTLARRTEQALADIPFDDEAWKRIQSHLSQDYTDLGRALSALGHQAQMDQTADYGLVVTVVYQNRPERPDHLTERLEAEITQRRELLTAREREVLENHLQAEIAAAIQRLLQDGERKVDAINAELYKRPTSTGVRFRLQWLPLAEGVDGAPVGLEAARKRLLNTSTDLWSPEDRSVVGAMLQDRINTERANADAVAGGSLLDQLSRALDYRRWHRFTVQRWQDKQWRKLSGPASSGERALGLTVPLFAAVASFYSQSGSPHSPRLVLLDEVFAGIDDSARAHCMALIREFDLDFVVTSEREWGCYAELPGVSICQLQRLENIDAVHVSRWTWDGRAKLRESDPNRRFANT
jgi:uncharacterized protein (TIGR02680 family)